MIAFGAFPLLLPFAITAFLRIAKGGGGGKTYRAIWGGEPYCRAHPPNPVLDSSGLCPFPLKRMTGREQGGGETETYHRWGGGAKPFLGRGFMVCFPLR